MIDTMTSHPLFGVTVTLAAYVLSRALQRRYKKLHALFVTSLLLILLLLAGGIDYEHYYAGGELIVFFLGPATVALGVPFYKQFHRLRPQLLPIVTGVAAGCITGVASAAGVLWLLGGTREILLTYMPKSATAPISIEIVRQLGGYPELGAVLTVLTGLVGSMFGPELMKLVRIRTELAVGTAVGTAAHGIGTARMIAESEYKGSVSGFSMALAGVITSVIMIPVYWLVL